MGVWLEVLGTRMVLLGCGVMSVWVCVCRCGSMALVCVCVFVWV